MQIRPDARLAFLRFRDEGDTAALAQVFDLVAQQLLLVASHVAGRQQQPEDLLQETFLTAIQRADRYDGERPLEPWLVGILVNVTRNDRRRREREQPSDVIEPAPTLHQPSDAAIEAEFVASLTEAIAGLPVPQREVMTLNLVHGMTPTEIAHATSRPVGTVKSWIHRSLEVVRRRLPASMALTFGVLLRGMDGLTQVREAVLAEATRQLAAMGAGVAAAAVASGSAATTASTTVTPAPTGLPRAGASWLRWAAASLGAVALALAVATWWPDSRTSPSPAAAARPEASVETAAGDPVALQDTTPRDEATPVPMDAAPTASVHFVGEFAAGPFAWSGYVTVPTNPDAFIGAFALEVGNVGEHTVSGVPYGLYQLQPNRGSEILFVVDRPELTVKVPMSDGVDVRGRVVDARGVGVAGATVFSTFANSFELRLPVALTDERGDFVVPAATRGRYLEARLDGVTSSGLRQVPREGEAAPVELRLGEVAGVIGIEVVDRRGHPVAEASLQLGTALATALADESAKTRTMRLPWVGRTDRDGVATCRQTPVDRAEMLFVRAAGMAPAVVMIEPKQHGTTVRVELVDGASCSGVLGGIGGATSSAMARAIELGADVGTRAPTWFWPTCIADADGNYQLRGVPEGDVLLQAQSSRGELVERELIVAAGAELTWSPTFGEGGVVRGAVLDELGRPFSAGIVCARAVGCRPFFAAIDEQGAFALDGLPDRVFELLVQLDELPTAMVLQRHFGVRLGDEVTLRLPDGRRPTAVLRGKLGRVREKSVGLFECASGHARFASVDGDGRFELIAPPGDYHLMAGMQRILVRRDVTLVADDLQDLGVVDGDAECSVRIEAPSVATGEVAEIYAYADEVGPLFGYARLREPVGELELPAGRYRLVMVQAGSFVAQRMVDVAVDRDNVVVLEAADAVVTLRAFAKPSTPRVELRVLWQIEGADGVRRFAGSRGRIQPADRAVGLQVALPPGDYTVTARVPDGAPVSARVTLPMADGSEPLRLRLP